MPDPKTESVKLEKKIDRTVDGMQKTAPMKSYKERFKTVVSHDFADRSSWVYNSVEVDNEVATTSDDKNYSFADNRNLINLANVTQREDWQEKDLTVKVDGEITTSGYTVDYTNNNISFTTSGERTVEVSYAYEDGSLFELTPPSGIIYKLDYSETQFTEDAQINDNLIFEMILNNPSTGNSDYVAASVEYRNGADYLNRGNHGTVMRKFGELTKPINVFPWNYLTGYTIKPVGEDCDPNKHEFNKMRVRLKNNTPFNAEIATATFYCLEEDI